MYSSAVKASSLLLPLWRARNRYGNSTIASGCGDDARMSINILVPISESRGATSSATSRRSMKNPLTGSATGDFSSRRASLAPVTLSHLRRPEERPSELPSPVIPAGDHQIGRALAQFPQHAGQQTLVVLKIAVDHRHERRRGREDALDAG